MGFFKHLLNSNSSYSMTLSRWLFFLLIVVAVIGPAISYKSLYAFHLVLLANFLNFLFQSRPQFILQAKRLLGADHKMNYFLFFTLLYFLIWIPFAENQTYALKHFVFMGLGFSLTLFVVIRTKNLTDFSFLFRSLVFVYLLDLLVGVLEALQLFRWPISRLSSVNHWFGRENQLQQILDESISHEYVYSMPTGFHWNPNNFATFMLFGLPFFLFHKSYWKSTLGIVTVLLLIVSSGSKAAFLGAIVIFICSLFFLSSKLKNILTLFLCLLFLSTNGFHTLNGKSIKLDEVQEFVYNSLGIELEDRRNKSSEYYRMELLKHGFHIFSENPVVGIGGGNAQYIIENKGGVGEKKISNLHNFWLELLVEGGLFFFSFFAAWMIVLMRQFIRTLRRLEKNTKVYYWVSAFTLSAVGFLFSGIGPSSMIAYLPLYLFLGVALSLYYLSVNNHSHNRQKEE
jgi:teichuronic acid biosynthesis protein TuaE